MQLSNLSFQIHNQNDIISAIRDIQRNPNVVYITIRVCQSRIVSNDTFRQKFSLLMDMATDLPILQEVELAFHEVRKSSAPEEEGHYPASAIAEMIHSIPKLVTLELAVPKLSGEIESLALALSQQGRLTDVIFQQCVRDVVGGDMAPLLKALTSVLCLQRLIIEGVMFQSGCQDAALLLTSIIESTSLTKLQLQHCTGLGDYELVPLFQFLHHDKKLKHLKISNGFRNIAEDYTGNTGVRVLGRMIRVNSSLQSLLFSTVPTVSLAPIVEALKDNTTLRHIHLYNGSNSEDVTPTLAKVLQDHNFSLEYCNKLGRSSQEILFYTKLNRLGRRHLWKCHSTNSDAVWYQTIVSEQNDFRLVHYLLSHYPSLIRA